MNKQLLIIGASGHGKVLADIALKMNQWETIVFLDDDDTKTSCLGFGVIGKSAEFPKYLSNSDFVVAIGNNKIREKIQNELTNGEASIATLIHPNAVIATDVSIGVGTVIMAGVVINSSTLIGNGCIINTSSSLDHDNIIEDFVHLSPGTSLAGMVKIGKGTWLGIGSIVSNNVSICGGCNIGAGAVVIKEITKIGIYIGVPARKID